MDTREKIASRIKEAIKTHESGLCISDKQTNEQFYADLIIKEMADGGLERIPREEINKWVHAFQHGMSCWDCIDRVIDAQLAADQPVAAALKEQLKAKEDEIDRLKEMMLDADEAHLLVGLVEHSAPTDDWNINALKTCAAFFKLKTQAKLSKQAEEAK